MGNSGSRHIAIEPARLVGETPNCLIEIRYRFGNFPQHACKSALSRRPLSRPKTRGGPQSIRKQAVELHCVTKLGMQSRRFSCQDRARSCCGRLSAHLRLRSHSRTVPKAPVHNKRPPSGAGSISYIVGAQHQWYSSKEQVESIDTWHDCQELELRKTLRASSATRSFGDGY